MTLTTIIIIGLLCLIVGFLINFIFFPRNTKLIKKFNMELEQTNEFLYTKNKELTSENEQILKTKETLINENHQLELEKKTKEQDSINQTELYKEKMKHLIEIKTRDYNDDFKKLSEEFNEKLEDLTDEVELKKTEIIKQLTDQKTLLEEVKEKYAAAIEVSKRIEEEKNAKDFYRICLPQDSATDITYLTSIEKYLINREVLSKLIYKNYYEKPLNMMVGRVVGSTIKTGIYKITNLENNMSYVGQAVDIADRWKTHTKRALGAEPITTNKLYPIMKEVGPENFSFEIIEELPKDKLNEREHYWIDFYKTQSYGYNIKG